MELSEKIKQHLILTASLIFCILCGLDACQDRSSSIALVKAPIAGIGIALMVTLFVMWVMEMKTNRKGR